MVIDAPKNQNENSLEATFPCIEPEFLSIFGEVDDPKADGSEPVLPEVVSRWVKCLQQGLNEETKQSLLKKYLPPENFQEVRPPKINPEVKVAVAENTVRRDARISSLQEQIGTAISITAAVITKLIHSGGTQNKVYIEMLNDSGRLLSDAFHTESVSRRELLAINLNKDLKDTLKNTPINDFLFGADLENTIKTAKDLEKSGEQLKQKKTSTARPSTSQHPENFRRPSVLKRGAQQSGQGIRASNFNRRTHCLNQYSYHQQRRQDSQQRSRQPQSVKRRH